MLVLYPVKDVQGLMNITKWILLIIGVVMFTSCVTYKRVGLFQDAPITASDNLLTDSVFQVKLITIQPNDVLNIDIGTSKQGFDKLFQSDAPNASSMIGGADASNYFSGNFVDNEGFVRLPILGKINLEGKTIPEAEEIILNKAKEFLTDPFVNIKFANFKIQVIGDVNKPGSFTVANEKTDALELLSTAGGFTENADTKKILLIRSRKNKKYYFQLDLTTTNSLNSPAYNLEPHDIIVVNSLPRKFLRTNLQTFTPAVILINTAITLFTLFFLRNN
jgi:polysaccharide export outer membrane protein